MAQLLTHLDSLALIRENVELGAGTCLPQPASTWTEHGEEREQISMPFGASWK